MSSSPFEIHEVLGRGAMAVVHRARQVALNRWVALKILHPRCEVEPVLLGRLKREARVLGTVRHPNLVEVIDSGEIDGHPFIAMELVEGQTLSACLRTDPMDIRRQADDLFGAIVGAVAALHAAHLVHRDLKPENVMIAHSGRVVVMDLGLVKDLDGVTQATATGALVGTPAYMAPELFADGQAQPRSDVWALGCLYYDLYAGQRLFQAETLDGLIQLIAHGPTPDLLPACPDLPPHRRVILEAMLQRDPGHRPRDAVALRELWTSSAPGDGIARRSKPGPALVRPTRAGNGGAKSGAPPGASMRRGAVVVATVGLVGVAAFMARGPRTSTDRGSLVSTGSAATALGRVGRTEAVEARFLAPPSPLPVSWRWRAIEARRSDLLAGEERARIASKDLVATVGMNFHRHARAWLFWLDLGRWLELSRRPPRKSPQRSNDEGSLSAEMVYEGLADRLMYEDPAILLQVSVAGAQIDPGVTFHWLVMAYALEREHPASLPKAQAVYDIALSLPIPTTSQWSRQIWFLLARALLLAPGHSVEKEFWSRIPPGARAFTVFRGLREALEDHPDLLEKVIDAAPDREAMREDLILARGDFFRIVRRDPVRARAEYLAGLSKQPQSTTLALKVAGDFLRTGETREARAAMATVAEEVSGSGRLDYLDDGPKAPDMALPPRGSRHRLALIPVRLTQGAEKGEGAAVWPLLEEAWSQRKEATWRLTQAALNLVGAAVPPEELESMVVAGLRSAADDATILASLWEHAAGVVDRRRGLDDLARWFQASDRPGRDRIDFALLRSLWLARSGQFDLALAYPTANPGLEGDRSIVHSMSWEVLARPLFAAGRGLPVSSTALAHARAHPGPGRKTVAVEMQFWDAIVHSRWAQVEVAALRLMHLADDAAFWPLAAGWAARLARPQDNHGAILARLRAALRERHALWALRELE